MISLGWRYLLLLPVALAGCGGSDDGPGVLPDGPRAIVIRDSAIGYELRIPDGWKVPPDRSPGAPVPVGGEGRGCVIGPAGTLPDLSTRAKLLGFARRTALKSAAGGRVVVEPVRGANVDGAAVRVLKAGGEGRSAIFASAGGGVALTCLARGGDAGRFDRGLPSLYASVKLPRDSALERLQPRIAAIEGVAGAALRRLPGRVAVQMRLEDFGAARGALTAALRLAGAELDGEVGVSASNAEDPSRLAAARVKGGQSRGFVQIIPDDPVEIAVPR